MVNIKDLSKERVMEALNREAERRLTASGSRRIALGGEISFERLIERATVCLCGDEFDERVYDKICGEGAAQRAVDSIRAEREDGGDAAKNASGEKKKPTMEEKVELVKGAVDKILGILTELPPDVCTATVMYLQMRLPGPGTMGGLAGLMMMGGPFSPSALFRSVEKPMGWPTGMGPRGRFG